MQKTCRVYPHRRIHERFPLEKLHHNGVFTQSLIFHELHITNYPLVKRFDMPEQLFAGIPADEVGI